MRFFKKMAAMLVAVAMICGMVSMVSFAAGDITLKVTVDKASVKTGETITVSVFIEGADRVGMSTWSIEYDATAFEYVENSINSPFNGGVDKGSVRNGAMNMMSFVGGSVDGVVQTAQFKAIKEVEDTEEFGFVTDEAGAQVCDASAEDFAITFVNAVVSIVPSFTAAYATPVAETVEIGTSEADVIAALPATVVVKDSENGTKTANATATGWACVGTFDSAAAGTLTFESALELPADSAATLADGLKATATVTVAAITTCDEPTFPAKITMAPKAEGEAAYTLAELQARVVEAIPTITVKKGDVTDTYTITDAVVAMKDGETAGTVKGDTTVMTITLSGASDNGKFNLTTAKVLETTIELKKSNSGIEVPGLPTGSTSAPSTGGVPSAGTDNDNDADVPADTEDPADTEEPADTEDPADGEVVAPVAGLFEDVANDYWAYDYIKQMKDMGVVSGKTATSFEPEATITRAEFVKMIAVAFGLEIGATDSTFADCGADDWYTPYVVAAAEAGYVNGISATEFGANDQISRQDICAILGRILGLTEDEFEATFTDIDEIADYALVAVKTLAAAGILNGYEDGSFAPAKSATRAEVCKILSSILSLVTEDEAAEEEVVEEVIDEAIVEEEVVEEEVVEVEEEVVDEK